MYICAERWPKGEVGCHFLYAALLAVEENRLDLARAGLRLARLVIFMLELLQW